MTAPADCILRNGRVHTLASPAPDGEPDAEAVAIRDGRIVRVADDYEIEFLEGVETETIDLGGRTLLPGFVDAHTHLEHSGQYLVHADLSAAESREAALEALADRAADTEAGWVLGFGYDESAWGESSYLRREELDSVSTDRPVAAIRVDMHTASLNGEALARTRESMADEHVRVEDGEPTGVVVEDAVGVVSEAYEPDVEGARELVRAAADRAAALGITCVHDKVRGSHAPRVYRELALAGELPIRVRVDYWRHHLDAVEELGLRTNAGGAFVRVGGIKTFTDGSFGGRTARVRDPYADAPEGSDHPRGQWVVEPDDYRAVVERADGAGLQVVSHAIGDEAIELALSAYEATDDPAGSRHRIEHAELATDDQLERMAAAGVVASVQPNFHQWADDDGLYERRLGPERTARSNPIRRALDAGVPLAFGSDSMPMDPLLGVEHAVSAPHEAGRCTVGEALRAYTHGAAYAGFDEDRLGTVEVGKRADLVVLDASPWAADSIADVDVWMTLVDGRITHEG